LIASNLREIVKLTSMTFPKIRCPIMEYPMNTIVATIKKWIRSGPASHRERVTTPRRGWKSISFKMRAMSSNMLMPLRAKYLQCSRRKHG
jgi:hypothetical protein